MGSQQRAQSRKERPGESLGERLKWPGAQKQEVWYSFAPSADPRVALRVFRTDVSRVEKSFVKPRALAMGQELLLSPTACVVGAHSGRRACVAGKRNSLYRASVEVDYHSFSFPAELKSSWEEAIFFLVAETGTLLPSPCAVC